MQRIKSILADKRGDETYMSTAMGLIISVVLGGLIMGLFALILSNFVSPGLQNAFANTEDYTVIEPTTDGTTLPHS